MSLWEIDLPDDLLCWQDSGFHMMPEVLDFKEGPFLRNFSGHFFRRFSRGGFGVIFWWNFLGYFFTWEGDEFGGEMDPLYPSSDDESFPFTVSSSSSFSSSLTSSSNWKVLDSRKSSFPRIPPKSSIFLQSSNLQKFSLNEIEVFLFEYFFLFSKWLWCFIASHW